MVIGKKGLEVAKAGYKEAVDRGDRDEQARWANQVGHACKERGQYVEALKWFRKDYEISTKRMCVNASPPGNLMPTCQSIGEIYLRLNDFEQALIYQRKHFQLAEETDNLVEQQRASTQLGRTYVEIYEQKDDFSALRNAKEYLKIAMDLAKSLKENPPSRDSPSFVKELVDAYNNMGLLMMVIDDHRQAASLFQQGLRICNEEEIREDDDARSRIHHNLGRLYCERREWDKAKHHTQADISICQRIPHPQGEAKGFINLGEMHFKCQRYEEATRCFERALQVAQPLEDEDDLVSTAQKNLEVVCQAEEKLLKLTVGEQQLKKLQRKKLNETAIKAGHHVEEYKLLNDLIGLAENLQAWEKHLKLAKSLKAVVKDMGDMEKLGDALETVGESYYNLRDFAKAKKWHLRSWDLCKRIGHLEGQSVAMINYGNALDCTEDWEQALKAYKDAYEIARSQGKTRMLAQQISALENMQYCYFVRLEWIDDAKAIESRIKVLKELRDKQDTLSEEDEHCSETDVESEACLTPSKSDGDKGWSKQQQLKLNTRDIETDLSDNDDAPLASALPPKCLQIYEANKMRKKDQVQKGSQMMNGMQRKDFRCPEKDFESLDCSQLTGSRKRPRVVHLDDDDDKIQDNGSETHASAKAKQSAKGASQHVPEVLEFGQPFCQDISLQTVASLQKSNTVSCSPAVEANDKRDSVHRQLSLGEEPCDMVSPCNKDFTAVHAMGDQLETSDLGSVKSGNRIPVHNVDAGVDKFTSQNELQTSLENQKEDAQVENRKGTLPIVDGADSNPKQVPDYATIDIGGQLIKVNLMKLNKDNVNSKTVDWLKQEIVNIYGSSNPAGLKPLLRHLALKGRILQPLETLESVLADLHSSDILEAVVDCWVRVPLVERYQLFCELYQQTANVKLMSCLRESKALEDKISASECNLDDNSAWPLLMALSENGSFSHLDLSHNSIGSQSMQKIQQLIAASNQPNLGLILDLHNNRLGAASVVHVCECPVILSRLEILNLSGNRLTDSAARYLTQLLRNSKALEVLKLEDCSLTSRSILKISSALHSNCPLVKLSIGKNNPISSLAITGLLEKLSSLSNFSELDVTGVSLDKQGVEALGRLLKSSQTIVTLMLGETCIQNEGVTELSHAIGMCHRMIVKLDVSSCGLTFDVAGKFCTQVGMLRSLTYLNLGGNKLGEKGALQMASVLSSSECRFKALMLKRSQLGWTGILIIMKSLQGNTVLQKLILSGNNPAKDSETLCKNPEHPVGSLVTMGQATLLDHKLEPKTPTSHIATEGLKPNHEFHDVFVGEETVGSMEASAEGGFPHLGKNTKTSLETAKGNNEEIEGILSSLLDPKGVKLSVVSDSEDDGEEEQSSNKNLDADCVSTSKHQKAAESEVYGSTGTRLPAAMVMDCSMEGVTDEFARALAYNEGLKFLDVSDNGLTTSNTEKLFSAWIASTRWVHQPKRHTIDRIVHFTADSEECCGSKPCCDIS